MEESEKQEENEDEVIITETKSTNVNDEKEVRSKHLSLIHSERFLSLSIQNVCLLL